MVLDKNSGEYQRRRERNNEALKRSRTKNKVQTLHAIERVHQIWAQNAFLDLKIVVLTRRLNALKKQYHFLLKHNLGQNPGEVKDRDLPKGGEVTLMEEEEE
jgi:hypothetical protein